MQKITDIIQDNIKIYTFDSFFLAFINALTNIKIYKANITPIEILAIMQYAVQ